MRKQDAAPSFPIHIQMFGQLSRSGKDLFRLHEHIEK